MLLQCLVKNSSGLTRDHIHQIDRDPADQDELYDNATLNFITAFNSNQIRGKLINLYEFERQTGLPMIEVVVLSIKETIDNLCDEHGNWAIRPEEKMHTDDERIVAWIHLGEHPHDFPMIIVRADLENSQYLLDKYFENMKLFAEETKTFTEAVN